MTEKKKTLEDFLVEAIKKSGYPLEIEISNLLDKNYFVSNTQYYFDEEAKQGRDIDIFASPLGFISMDMKLAPFGVRTEVPIECKKSETHAWVFYTRPRIPINWVYTSGQWDTTIPKPIEFSTKSFDYFFKEKCFSFHYDEFEKIAIAYDEIKKKKIEKGKGEKVISSKREIFEAVNQLVRFTSYEIHQSFNRIAKIPKRSDKEIIIIFFPTIAFDGDMYEVSFDYNEPKLEKKNHILLSTRYRCPICQEARSFMIDVVHRSYFSQFLEILNTDFQKVRDNILTNCDELVNRAKGDKIKEM